MQNLRAALDHAIEELTVRYVGHSLERTEFPIFKDPGLYWKLEATGKKRGLPFRGSGFDKTRGIPCLAIQAFIESRQPYNGLDLDRHPLWMLHELSNMDKHRQVAVVGATMIDHMFGIGGGGTVNLQITHVSAGAFDHGTEIARWRNTGSSRGVRMENQIAFDIAFAPTGPAPGCPVGSTLRTIDAHVRTIIDTLRLAFIE